MAGDGRGLSLVGFPEDLLALIIRDLGWQERWRLAVTCRRLLHLVPSIPFQLPNSLEVFMHNLAMAGWLRLVARSRGGRWAVKSLAVDLCPASATLGEAETHKLLPTRAAPLPVWHNVATLLQHAAPRDSLSLQGLGLPADAAPGAFTHAGRAIIAAARGLTNLTDLELHMGFQGAAPGQPFYARLDAGAFPRLKRLVVQNTNDGLDGEVMLTLGHMPWLRLLNVANAGRGGWVVLRSPLRQVESIVIINSCPQFASAESGLPGVRTLALFTRRARGERRWGREMVGCGGLIESLPALEDVRVYGGVADHYRMCKALKEHLDDAEQQVEARVQVLAFPYGVDSDGEHGA